MKLNGFVVEAVRLLTVSVLLCPPKIDAGLNEQVAPAEQARVMLPVKLLGADAATDKTAELFPIKTVVVGPVEESEKTATPVPVKATI